MNRTKCTLLFAVAALLFGASAQAADLTVVSPGLSSETSVACPTGCKLSVNFDGVDLTNSFLVSAEPAGETVFRAEFWINPNTITLPTAPTKTVRFLEIRKDAPGGRILAFASIFFRNGTYRVNFIARGDANQTVPVAGYVVPDGNSRFIVEWQAASAAGMTDGTVTITRGTNTQGVTGYDYFNGGTGVDSVRFGSTRTADAGINGSLFLDTYSSFRTLAP